MEVSALLDAMALAERLKTVTRHSWLSSGRQESVAEHSWRMALMACLMADEFPGLDIAKTVRMCLFHDLGEAFTGDIPVFEKNAAHEVREAQLLDAWVASQPEPQRRELAALYAELAAGESPEARLCKALDKLEVTDQHNRADLSTWIPLEYTLNLTHGTAQTAWHPYLQAVKAAINAQTREKLQAASRRPDGQPEAIAP